jgi:hypothetical protein
MNVFQSLLIFALMATCGSAGAAGGEVEGLRTWTSAAGKTLQASLVKVVQGSGDMSAKDAKFREGFPSGGAPR